MDLIVKPSQDVINSADRFLKIMDSTRGLEPRKPMITSKLLKDIKTIKPVVVRYFENPGQIISYYGDGEFDLMSIFKLLKCESLFLKAVEKKMSLATKTGFNIVSDNDEYTKYFDKRFLMMKLSTGISIEETINKLLFYLFTCNNAFLIKVRSSDTPEASSYKKDGKEMNPIVGLFISHPVMMKQKFKFVKENGMYKAVIDKWVHTNKRGQIKLFDPEDVVHYTVNKEDGMILAQPSLLPVIDDIRTLRKIEEDIQLLLYRDLFPIIHYTVEKPQMVDHVAQISELQQARADMTKIVQDGGIATDARHKIEFVGSNGKHMDAAPYLEYFRQRVFTGLGVSALDMSDASAGNLESASSVSNTLIDSVKYFQNVFARQFNDTILLEMALCSPFDDILNKENMPKLTFEEVDIEWKIRQENHEADLFAKNTKTIHEVRNKRGEKTLSDQDLMYTHGALFGSAPPHKTLLDTEYGDKYVQHKGDEAHATTVPTTTVTSGGGTPSKTTHVKPMTPAKTTKSAAKRDSIKSAGTNSNIVKKKGKDFILEDAVATCSLKDSFLMTLQDTKKPKTKIDIIFLTKYIYDSIKQDMVESIKLGIQDACDDLGVDDANVGLTTDIFNHLDKIRDDVSNRVHQDPTYKSKAANRIAIAHKTEKNRAYNYGYAKACINNNHNKVEIYSTDSDVSEDSLPLLGKQIELTDHDLLDIIPPFRPNSRLKLRVVTDEQD